MREEGDRAEAGSASFASIGGGLPDGLSAPSRLPSWWLRHAPGGRRAAVTSTTSEHVKRRTIEATPSRPQEPFPGRSLTVAGCPAQIDVGIYRQYEGTIGHDPAATYPSTASSVVKPAHRLKPDRDDIMALTWLRCVARRQPCRARRHGAVKGLFLHDHRLVCGCRPAASTSWHREADRQLVKNSAAPRDDSTSTSQRLLANLLPATRRTSQRPRADRHLATNRRRHVVWPSLDRDRHALLPYPRAQPEYCRRLRTGSRPDRERRLMTSTPLRNQLPRPSRGSPSPSLPTPRHV